MNKENLLVKISEIPTFMMRDVAVKESNIIYGEDGEILNTEELKDEWVEKEKFKAVTEMNNTIPLAFVSHRYQLVQFRDMFRPIVKQIEECEGDLVYHHGFAIMDVFPSNEEYKVGSQRVGIVAYNSVDKTSALNIRFCIDYGGRRLTIPSKVASFRKVHLGKIGEMTQDYISVITKIKTAWETVVDKFTNYTVIEDDLVNLCESFDVDTYIIKKIKKKMLMGKKFNLWDFCMESFDVLTKRKYKSDVHRRKRMDKFVKSIFDYEMVMEI